MYPVEVKIASKKGWQYPNEARAYYGRYSREGLTVHWWNSPDKAKDSDHDKIVNYILNKASKGTGSVNYVLSNNKITLVVEPDNVAWASQKGNPTTISCEFSPHLNAEGYKKAGWLIWQLEKRYNRKLTLYPHKYWFSTQCPGILDMSRMRAEANKWASGVYNPKPPTPAPAKAKLTWTKITPQVYVTNKQPTHLWNFDSTAWDMKSVKDFNKGEQVTIFGKCVNEALKATYLVTEFSYIKQITNGFNQNDLDLFVPPPPVIPAPQPKEPPKTDPDHSGLPEKQPDNPSPPVPKEDSDYEARLSAIEAFIVWIKKFLKIGG